MSVGRHDDDPRRHGALADRPLDRSAAALPRTFPAGPVSRLRVPQPRAGRPPQKFFYSSTEPIKDHATKLNLLGDLIGFAAEDPSDLLVFVDGDAFPVAPIGPLVEERLERHRLIAVQRRENNRDIQPHPCFCVTTVGFWREIGGDWHRGYEWPGPDGAPVTDVGANLLEALERDGVDWYRSAE